MSKLFICLFKKKSRKMATKEEKQELILERREAARLRAAERQARENAEMKRIFGLPMERGGITMNPVVIYGFAYITNQMDHWNYKTGTFQYLYGFLEGTSNILEHSEEGYINHAFLF